MVNILGFNIFDGTKDEYMKSLLERYKKGEKVVIVSGNPEVLHSISNSNELMSMIPYCDIIPDGIGVLIAGKIKRQPFAEKIAGIEIVEELLKESSKGDLKIYMLGAEEWVVEKAAEECRKKFGAVIAGYHDGYFNMDKAEEIADDINRSGANVLLVAMGCPRQELFIAKNKELINCKIFMGVGGSFDVLSGKTKRAPSWMVKTGLEWLYRVSNEPYRIKRLVTIPKFLLRVLFNKR